MLIRIWIQTHAACIRKLLDDTRRGTSLARREGADNEGLQPLLYELPGDLARRTQSRLANTHLPIHRRRVVDREVPVAAWGRALLNPLRMRRLPPSSNG
jgi:hypothetical protein